MKEEYEMYETDETQLEAEHLKKFQPFPFVKNTENGGNDRVYGQIYLDELVYWGEDGGGQMKVSASLVNEQMLNMEYEARERENTPLFFYEFQGEKTFSSNLQMTKANIRYFQGEQNNFYILRIIDVEALDDNAERILENYAGRMTFEGEITFSASPVLSHKVVIVVEDTVEKADKAAYEKLNKTYDTWNTTIKKKCIYDNNVISAELYKLFDNTVKSCEVRIYNVGQANCCYCDLTTKKIFFDIGVARSSKSLEMPLIKSAVQEISTLDADAVILSHWDLDHILGVCYNQKCMEGKIWVVPDFKKLYSHPMISIKRVCNYLIKNGKSKLLMVDTSVANKLLFVSRNGAVTIYRGEPKASCGVNKKNNGGLLLKLNNSKNIFMPGDCENRRIPKAAVKTRYDYVIVPHHGAVMSRPTLCAKLGKKKTKKKTTTAYISCGVITGNCSLDSDIADKYKKNKFGKVQYTEHLKKHNKYSVKL